MICRAIPSVSARAGAISGSVAAEHPEREAADRAGDAAAVHGEVVEALVALLPAVHLAAGHQLPERLERYRVAGEGVRQGDEHRIVPGVLPGRERVQVPAHPGQRGELLARRRGPVADVVDATGERVQRRHGLTLRRGQQPDAVGEVARLGPGDLLAAGVGGLDIDVDHRRPPKRPSRTPRLWAATEPFAAFGRCREHVETDGLDGGELGEAPADEPCHGEARSAREQADERCAGPDQPRRPAALEAHQPAEGRGRGARGDDRLVDAEAGQVLLRQVDAPGREVLGDVLPVLDELQPGADPIGELDRERIGTAEDGEHQVPHRVGGEPAVRLELLVRRVAADHLVLAVRRHEVGEGLPPDADGADRRAEPAEHRMRGLTHESPVELGLHPVELRAAVALGEIADVVHEASEAVDREQVLALGPRQQAGGHREVLGIGLRHDVRSGERRLGGCLAGRDGAHRLGQRSPRVRAGRAGRCSGLLPLGRSGRHLASLLREPTANRPFPAPPTRSAVSVSARSGEPRPAVTARRSRWGSRPACSRRSRPWRTARAMPSPSRPRLAKMASGLAWGR